MTRVSDLHLGAAGDSNKTSTRVLYGLLRKPAECGQRPNTKQVLDSKSESQKCQKHIRLADQTT